MEAKIIELLMQRLNHLEVLIFSSIIGMFLTTTTVLLGGLLALKNDAGAKKTETISAEHIVQAVAFFYFFLSCYYSFTIAHFYSTCGSLFPLLKEHSTGLNMGSYWSYYDLPEWLWLGGSGARKHAILYFVPFFPVFLSVGSIFLVRAIIKYRLKTTTSKWTIGASSVLLTIPSIFVFIGPFSKFIEQIK